MENESHKQILLSLLKCSATVELALERYEERVRNKPLPVHPTTGPSNKSTVKVEDPHVKRRNTAKPKTKLKRLDAREQRRIVRGIHKEEIIALKRNKLRKRRRRNERKRKHDDKDHVKEDNGPEEVESEVGNKLGFEKKKKPEKKKEKTHDKTHDKKPIPQAEFPNDEDDLDVFIKSITRHKNTVRKRRAYRHELYSNGEEERKRLESLVIDDEETSDQEVDEPIGISRPKPLSSAEKKRTKLLEMGPDATRFRVYMDLHMLWQRYVFDLIGLDLKPSTASQRATAAQKLASADLHGAYIVVDRSSCVSRVGLAGIVVRETKSSFLIVTKANLAKIVPKEHTVFRVAVKDPKWIDLDRSESDQVKRDREVATAGSSAGVLLHFYVYGSQLLYRPADRSGKKFKTKPTLDL
ncbi:hypothetical protein V1512DRAFT_267062 [Lipomyces arxii]|uniref:uncharacterized protein n=1 Tax=Lipomyces arxii TaxID=56418 RepID=UPI0034CE0371